MHPRALTIAVRRFGAGRSYLDIRCPLKGSRMHLISLGIVGTAQHFNRIASFSFMRANGLFMRALRANRAARSR